MFATQGYTYPAAVRSRDPAYERAFLDDVEYLVAQIQGLSYQPEDKAYARKVVARLNLGAQRYGDLAYLTRDNLAEVEEETPDVAAYAVLELQRLRVSDPSVVDEVRADLVTAAAYAAIADGFVRRARRKLT